MELRQLKYFVTIAETLNFSKAAAKLFISQSSLSKQIMLLESDLGTVLFKRNRQRVELTEVGRVLYIKAKDLIEDAEGIPALLSSFTTGEKCERLLLNIGITDVLLNIPLYAKAFLYAEETIRLKYPQVEINMVPTRMSKVKKDLSSSLIDLGIVVTDDLQNKNLADLNYNIFQEFPVYLVSDRHSTLGAKPSKEEVKEFLKGRDVFIHSARSRVHMQAYQICSELDARPNSISTKENPRLFVLVAQGKGVSFSWDGVVEQMLQEHLHFSALPVPSAKVYAFFCWGRVDQYIQEFSSTYWEYVKAGSAQFWHPVDLDFQSQI